LASGESYNKLSIVRNQAFTDDITALDWNADGTLNETEEGSEDLYQYQRLYEKVLERGIKSGNVIKDNSHFFVAYNPM
jgi:hypothetical protein